MRASVCSLELQSPATEMDIFLLMPLIFVLPLLFFLFGTKNAQLNKAPLPPSPPKLPIIGHLHRLGSLPHQMLRAFSQQNGPLVLLQLGRIPALVVSSAEAACEVMKTQDLVFASRPSLMIAKKLFYNCNDIAFAPYGDAWRQARKIGILHLLNAKRVQSFAPIRKEEVEEMIAKITASIPMGPVDVSFLLNSFANEVISRVALGKKYYVQKKGEKNKFCEVVEEMSKLFGEFHMEDYFPSLGWLSVLSGTRARVQSCFRQLDSFLDQVLADHLDRHHDLEQGDLVDVLLSLKKDPDGNFLDNDCIKGIILDMFSAGTDTSYIVLEWAMTELVRNPKLMKKVQDEIRGITKGRSMVLENEETDMQLLTAVIKEVLRLHPPLPLLVQRESMEYTKVQGYDIPSKTRVMVNAWAIGRDPKYWEAAEEFCPERFIGSSIDFKGHDFQLIPFGAGRRICPGMSFAISTVGLALANLLLRFDWRLPDNMSIEDFDMEEAPGITARRKSPLFLVAVPYQAKDI